MWQHRLRAAPGRASSPHLYLPRPLAGVFNADGIKGHEDVILCESILDAMTFYAADPADPILRAYMGIFPGLFKPLGVTQGISDVPWHKDCSLGGHSYRCCSLTVGISVTGADATSGGDVGWFRVRSLEDRLRDAQYRNL